MRAIKDLYCCIQKKTVDPMPLACHALFASESPLTRQASPNTRAAPQAAALVNSTGKVLQLRKRRQAAAAFEPCR